MTKVKLELEQKTYAVIHSGNEWTIIENISHLTGKKWYVIFDAKGNIIDDQNKVDELLEALG
jgi:hypothetical protein